MKVSEAIKALDGILKTRGDITLYFDCPDCKQAFTPTTAAVTVTFGGKSTKA